MGFPQVVAIDDEEIRGPPLLEPRVDDIQPKQHRRRHTTPPPRAKAVGMPPKKLDGSSLRRSSSSNLEPQALPSRIPVSRRSRSGGGAVSKAWKWFRWRRSGIKSLLGGAVFITLLAHGASGQFFEQIIRMASAIARVSESASLAASTVIDRGTDFATATSTAVLTFATGAANCEKTSGVVTAEHNLVLLEWLQSHPAGLALMGGNLTEVTQLWQYLIQSVGLSLPQLKIAREFLSTTTFTGRSMVVALSIRQVLSCLNLRWFRFTSRLNGLIRFGKCWQWIFRPNILRFMNWLATFHVRSMSRLRYIGIGQLKIFLIPGGVPSCVSAILWFFGQCICN